MKFAEFLSAHITPEWRKQYLNYEGMKEMLYHAVEKCKSQSTTAETADVENPTNSHLYDKYEKLWLEYSEQQLIKINLFFAEKLDEAKKKYEILREDLNIILAQEKEHHNHNHKGLRIGLFGRKKKTKICKMHDLKLAFSEFYLSLVLLRNYQKLNFTGFRKIQKKHDKLFSTSSGAKWNEVNVHSAHFHACKDNNVLIQQIEATVINVLEDGNRPKAMKRLRVPPLGMRQNPWTTFKVGLLSGVFLVLLACVLLTGLFQPDQEYRIILRLYRGPFLLILFLFLLSINIYGWRSSGVNHILIFELDPRSHLSELHLMEMAAVLSVFWILSILAFLCSNELNIAPYTSPLALVIVLAAFLLNPTNTFHHDARFWLLRLLRRIVCAPFYYVGFADFWLGDQLNSLVQVLLDFQYIICFYATSNGNFETSHDDAMRCQGELWSWLLRSFISVLPAWFRFMQCARRYHDTKQAFPHLANAGKYSTTFFVMLFSTLYKSSHEERSGFNNVYFYLWIMSALTSSIYAYVWDIKMDWGLFDANPGQNKYLRKEIVYSAKLYYFGMVEDLILRFGWVMSISMSELDFMHTDIIVSILTPLELIRRFIWNFFRLENEHLNNCGDFRAVRDISIASLHASERKHTGFNAKSKKTKQFKV